MFSVHRVILFLSAVPFFFLPVTAEFRSSNPIQLEILVRPPSYVLYLCLDGTAYEATSEALKSSGLELSFRGIKDTYTNQFLSLENNVEIILARTRHTFIAKGPCRIYPKILDFSKIPSEELFDGKKKKSRIPESLSINDYATSVRTSPTMYASVGRKKDPKDRPLVTLGITKHRQGSATKIEYATYFNEWYRAENYHNFSMVLHLNGISNKLPFYIFTDMYTAHHNHYNASLQADTFGLGVELPLSPMLNAKAELARGYYSGNVTTLGGVKLDANFSLNNLIHLQRTPPGQVEKPLLSAGLGGIYSGNTKHLRYNQDDISGKILFVPKLFLNAYMTGHLNAITHWLPFYGAVSIVNAIDPESGKNRFMDTYTVGLEQAITKYFTARAEFGKMYYQGAHVSLYSFGLSSSVTLNDLTSLFKKPAKNKSRS